jgi:hypothetical protein
MKKSLGKKLCAFLLLLSAIAFFPSVKVKALPTFCNMDSNATTCCNGAYTTCSFPEDGKDMFCGGKKVAAYTSCTAF